MALHRDLGLTDEELEAIRDRLGRDPTYTELAMFSVMWSEHCSYKSSRVHLKTLPTEGPHVVVGPGEGAGIVEVAPGVRIAWKVESHNHPSFVEPFNGAATGVGGIVRDILSMGARPIALMDSLRFGPLGEGRLGGTTEQGVARTRYLVDGVVHGISSYGNSIGVPTVGGEAIFEECYAENPLVNVACLGVVEDALMHGRAEGPGNPVVLFGSSTGRDGIGGASILASAEFDEDSLEKRPSVQVGDPFTEKLLIEASLELIRRGLVAGFQDLGAGGISCPTSEMSAKAGTGMVVDVDKVHRREPGMEPFEVMISESQERMMAVVEPQNLDEVLAVCRRWGLEASVLGEVSKDGRLKVIAEGEVVADAPAEALAEEGPVYQRPFERPAWLDEVQSRPAGDEPPADLRSAFLALLSSPGIASKRWIWEQYDHMIFLGTVRGPGSDAAVIRLPGTDVAVAISVDGPGRLCYLDPYLGALHAVAEAARNVACSGGRPLAVTNCLNFGNPEKPDVMWQFAEVVRGIGDACKALGTPVTGGNVSFYNETMGRAIYPTPVIGMAGVCHSPRQSVGLSLGSSGDALLLLGRLDPEAFGGSEFAKVVNGTIAGKPPALDLVAERRLHDLLFEAAGAGLLVSAHDVSSGGLAVTLAESAIAGRIGFELDLQGEPHRALFAEPASCVVASVAPEDEAALLEAAERAGTPVTRIGTVGGDSLRFGAFDVSVEEATNAFESALPERLSATIDA
ncbi:MAG TPA: phosphoribosylformylglycinamidine synthase subunit PurL [Actinomycetota bacterium]|nr:phosphoribosylformylglycinamidine synthase subunit PurL [Actinomycetota bacterium]